MSGAGSSAWVGTCHCGAVEVRLARAPDAVTQCNCSLCRKSGFLGVYLPGDKVAISGPLQGYVRSDIEAYLTNWRCEQCGVWTHWTPLAPPPHDRIGINARLFDPATVAPLPVTAVDGAKW